MELILGNCIEKMKDLPDGSIDLVLTDPPYGTTACGWDTCIPFEPMWEQLKRVTKKNGAIVLFGSQPFTSALVMSNPDMFKYEWVWEKNRASNPMLAKVQPLKFHENIIVFSEGKNIYVPQMKYVGIKDNRKTFNTIETYNERLNSKFTIKAKKDNGFRFPKSILKVTQEHFSKIFHPTQKPVALMEYLIKTYTNEGETVLDFCLGSGTTGIACLQTNREFIGIEKNEHYFEMAKKRIYNANKLITLSELLESTMLAAEK